MSKNGQIVTQYLDHYATIRAGLEAAKNGSNERLSDYNARLPRLFEENSRLWNECLDDGWSVEELNAAFRRRFPGR